MRCTSCLCSLPLLPPCRTRAWWQVFQGVLYAAQEFKAIAGVAAAVQCFVYLPLALLTYRGAFGEPSLRLLQYDRPNHTAAPSQRGKGIHPPARVYVGTLMVLCGVLCWANDADTCSALRTA
jgi:hypothetical protein